MTTENPRYPNFLDKKNLEFVDFHRSLDNLFRKLREEGVGAESKQTATITIEEENMLWDNTVTPKGLFRAVFYPQRRPGAQGITAVPDCSFDKTRSIRIY